MGKVNLDDIKPGMKLEKDVQERSGRVLLRAGTEITERHLNIFRTWGVAEADIESMSREEAAAQAARDLDPEVLKAAEEAIDPLFVHTDSITPQFASSKRLCVLRHVRLNKHNTGVV